MSDSFSQKALGLNSESIFSLLQFTKFKNLAKAILRRCSHIGALGVRWSLIMSSWSQSCQMPHFAAHFTGTHHPHKEPAPVRPWGLLKATAPRREVYLHLKTETWQYGLLSHFKHHRLKGSLLPIIKTSHSLQQWGSELLPLSKPGTQPDSK